VTGTSTPTPVDRSDVGEKFVGRMALIWLVVFLIVGAVITLAHLLIFWPTALESPAGSTQEGGLPPRKVVNYLGITSFTLSTEVLFFLIVGLAGALGALIHSIRSLSLYIGNRLLRWSWITYYALLPLVGILGGTLFYVVLRAGLFSPSTEVDQASPFGFAAVAALVGLFSQQAMEKLRELASQIFTQVPPSADHFEEESPPRSP
jgi:hypothetical protein